LRFLGHDTARDLGVITKSDKQPSLSAHVAAVCRPSTTIHDLRQLQATDRLPGRWLKMPPGHY